MSAEIAFFVDAGRRIIDFDVLLVASDGDVRFWGYQRRMTFGIRVAGSMKTDANQGGVIINSDGDKNADVVGQTRAVGGLQWPRTRRQ